MRLLIKELDPSEGIIRVAGRDLADVTRKRIPFYRRNLGVVFQDFKLLPSRTVYENVAYALQVTGSKRKEIRAKVLDILRLTGLSTKPDNIPTSCRAASSSECRSPARSSTTPRCCWPMSRPETSTPRRASTSCACCTGSTGPAPP